MPIRKPDVGCDSPRPPSCCLADFGTMADESGLDGAQAGRAAGWAIRTLIADLRARNEQAAAQDTTAST